MHARAFRKHDVSAPPKDSEERLCALYSRARFQAKLGEIALVLVFLAGISLTGKAHQLDEALTPYFPPGGSHVAIDLFLTLLGVRLLLLPLHWLSCYRLEHRFKLLHQSPGSWLRDWMLVSLLFAALATAILTPVVTTLRWWPWLLVPWVAVYI